MKVLVTGGAGFIGSTTVDRLLESGHFVRVLDNFSTGKRENLPDSPYLEIIEGDILDTEVLNRAMDGMTHVLHLAAMVSVIESINDPVHCARDNALGFVTVADSARRAGIQRMVYASSAAVYGLTEKLPIAETDPTQPISFYGLDKLYDDRSAALFSRLFGMSMLGMRYFNVYGPRQDPKSPYAGVISKFIQAIDDGQALTVFGDGLQTRDYIYVDDIARANVAALERSGITGVCNVATGRVSTLLELIDILKTHLGRSIDVNHVAPREGEARFAEADISRLTQQLHFHAQVELTDGIRILLNSMGLVTR